MTEQSESTPATIVDDIPWDGYGSILCHTLNGRDITYDGQPVTILGRPSRKREPVRPK